MDCRRQLVALSIDALSMGICKKQYLSEAVFYAVLGDVNRNRRKFHRKTPRRFCLGFRVVCGPPCPVSENNCLATACLPMDFVCTWTNKVDRLEHALAVSKDGRTRRAPVTAGTGHKANYRHCETHSITSQLPLARSTNLIADSSIF